MIFPPIQASQAAAGATLTIDLSAVRENYRRLRDRLGGTNCAAVVKADAYGLGAAEVTAALMAEGCRTCFVAHAVEGISLRRAVGTGPEIFVLHGAYPGAEEDCAGAELIPVSNSTAQLSAWRATATRLGRQLPVAVQLDTGMSRLGIPPAELGQLGADAFVGLDLRLVMSHLACADDPDNPVNVRQRDAFDRLRGNLPPAPASLANSSGVFLGRSYWYDLARPGAALYGVNPTPATGNPMSQVVTLEAKVVQVRSLPADTGIGYGHTYQTATALRTATIAAGYADGWPRRAAAAAFFEGSRLTFVGRVSMDSIVLDVSALPEGHPRGGDVVQLIGSDQTVDDVALLSGTIGYEILTGLGHRFHRRYLK